MSKLQASLEVLLQSAVVVISGKLLAIAREMVVTSNLPTLIGIFRLLLNYQLVEKNENSRSYITSHNSSLHSYKEKLLTILLLLF